MKKISLIFILLLAACTTEPVEIHDDNAILQLLLNMADSSAVGFLINEFDIDGNGTLYCMELPNTLDDTVACTMENGRFTKIKLSNMGLSGTIPESIGDLTELTHLGLKNNNLNGEIPESIRNLINLTQLSLGYNSLGGSIPESIGDLKKLVVLDVSHNNLEGSIPSSIRNLTALVNFLADSNNLNLIIPEDFCTIYPNLGNYDLSGNQFCPPLPSCIDTPDDIGFQNCDTSCGSGNTYLNGYCYSTGDLTALGAFVKISSATEDSLKLGKQEWHAGKLERLDCYWQDDEICHLAGDIPAELGNLSTLKYLDLQKSSLSGALPLSVGNLSNLEYLYLQDDSISGSLPETIGGMVNLKDFSIANNQLSGSIPESIGNLTELTKLDIQNNKLTGVLPESIGNLTNLTYLNISENQLDGIIPESICNLSNLLWDSTFSTTSSTLFNNQLCPPYPECIKLYVGEQNTSNCSESELP